MEIKYSLTTGNLFRANLLLSFYRSFKPMLLFLIIFLIYAIYSGTLAAFTYGVPLGIVSGVIISLIMGMMMASRNRHFAGNRTLAITKESYKYTGESFARETKWSEKMKNWYTPWYIFLDITSLYPVVIRRNALSEKGVSQLRELFNK